MIVIVYKEQLGLEKTVSFDYFSNLYSRLFGQSYK